MGKVTGKRAPIVMLASLALTVLVSQPALAQAFNVIYSFNIGPIGVFPFAGVTLDSHGNVYFKVLPVTASGKRSPISTVPISRDKTFVERQDVFRALELQFSHSNCHNRAVLTGLGGVG